MNIVQLYEPVEAELHQVSRLISDQLHSSEPGIEACLSELGRREGKMLRPAVTLLSGKMFSPLNHKHIQLAAMTELIHMASLIHDDVIDEADLRRGKASINALWGNTAAVLLGDFLLTRAFALGASCGNDAVLNCLIDSARDLCEGELCQNLARSRFDATEEDYFKIIEKKTAALFGGCCKLGAIVSDASDENIEVLYEYGVAIGLAFQVVDDLKDLISTVNTEGKTLGTDLLHGKMTLPIIHWLNLDRDHRQMFSHHTGVCESSAGFKDALVSSGSIQYAIDKAAAFTIQAQELLTELNHSSAKLSLRAIADYIISQISY